MNESLFFLHVLVIFGFAVAAIKLGKEALTAWVSLQAVLANLFVIKQISFFGFNVTCSDAFAIGSILGLNLLQEYFGRPAAVRALKICLFCMVFFVVMAQFHLFYEASIFDSAHIAYETILSASPRLLFASMTVFFFVQQVDVRIFSWLKKKHSKLLFRNGISLTLSQLLDTSLFSFLGLWGIADSLCDIIVVSFLIKLLIIALLSPVTAVSKRWIQPAEAA
ncbi:MAG: queuosine precursor transporter [Rhabdochlamydiaceae bacterium]|nr:queuosine precursor transporter [Rhabdochlamydiaceae bacterium]